MFACGVQKSLFHLHTQVSWKVTDIYLRCGDEGIYDDFFDKFTFLLDSINCLGKKLYLSGCTNSWQIQ